MSLDSATAAAEAFAAEMTHTRHEPQHNGLDPAEPGLGPRRLPGKAVPNTVSLSGAEGLARTIRRYWARHDVSVWVERMPEYPTLFQVRSNLGPTGLPAE